MKYMIIFTAVLAVSQSASLSNVFGKARYPQPTPVRAAPAPVRVSSSDKVANIVRYDSDIAPEGTYNYAFETDNGIAVQEQGTPRDFGGNPPLVPVVAQGNFAYTAPGGEPISISYIADENGFQPQGAAIPTPPPVPALIAKALDYLARVAP